MKSSEDVAEFNEMYVEGYLQGYWDAKTQITEIAKEVMTKAGDKLYEAVRKAHCEEDKQ